MVGGLTAPARHRVNDDGGYVPLVLAGEVEQGGERRAVHRLGALAFLAEHSRDWPTFTPAIVAARLLLRGEAEVADLLLRANSDVDDRRTLHRTPPPRAGRGHRAPALGSV